MAARSAARYDKLKELHDLIDVIPWTTVYLQNSESLRLRLWCVILVYVYIYVYNRTSLKAIYTYHQRRT